MRKLFIAAAVCAASGIVFGAGSTTIQYPLTFPGFTLQNVSNGVQVTCNKGVVDVRSITITVRTNAESAVCVRLPKLQGITIGSVTQCAEQTWYYICPTGTMTFPYVDKFYLKTSNSVANIMDMLFKGTTPTDDITNSVIVDAASRIATAQAWASQSAYATNAKTASASVYAFQATYATNTPPVAWASQSAYATNTPPVAWASQSAYATNAGGAPWASQAAYATSTPPVNWSSQAAFATNTPPVAWASQSAYATNAGTASASVYAFQATYATNTPPVAWASQSAYATNAGGAPWASQSAYATNSGATPWASQSAYATNAGAAGWAAVTAIATNLAPSTGIDRTVTNVGYQCTNIMVFGNGIVTSITFL